MKAQEKKTGAHAKHAAFVEDKRAKGPPPAGGQTSRPNKRRKVHVKEEPESEGDEGSGGGEDARERH
jgi:hypothetical protein